MTDQATSVDRPNSLTAPLRLPLFRRIWLASLLSNLGFMFLSVGAAWTMTTLTTAADKVALVQTALMAPMMLLSLAAGAIADMYDRRKVGLAALALSLTGGAALTAAVVSGLISPWLLLGFCFLMGTGTALFAPSWQASVSEQVPARDLPQAVALNSISFNIARSFGPAIGGLILAVAGASAAFGATALAYVPLFVVMLRWRRTPLPSRLPPERIDRAVGAGIRYVFYSQPIRTVVIRVSLIGLAGGSVSALMPLVTRELVGGGAQTYGVMLGAFGIGSVLGALGIGRLRARLSSEGVLRVALLLMAVAVAVVGASRTAWLSGLALLGGGIGWMIAVTLCNVAVQLAAPRWVTGRTLAAFQTAVAGGIAIGSWGWGALAQRIGVAGAMECSALALALVVLPGFVWPMPRIEERDHSIVDLGDPEVVLPLTGRSGPIIIEVGYTVPMENARRFYDRMRAVRGMRLRGGAYGWSIARDIIDPEQWCERFHCPTWNDYLRQRSRNTPEEISLHEQAAQYHVGRESLRVRRLLERPFGSVRMAEDTPDWGDDSSGGAVEQRWERPAPPAA